MVRVATVNNDWVVENDSTEVYEPRNRRKGGKVSQSRTLTVPEVVTQTKLPD
jgi:hypothetical protein